MKRLHYLLIIEGDVEPNLEGPFTHEEDVLTLARSHRENDEDLDDGLYKLSVNENGIPFVESFGGGELESGD